MQTEVILQIFNDNSQLEATRSFLLGSDMPIPGLQDIITITVADVSYQGGVYGRTFDYSEIAEDDGSEGTLRVRIDAQLQE